MPAQVRCPTCSGTVSESQPACPHCGQNLASDALDSAVETAARGERPPSSQHRTPPSSGAHKTPTGRSSSGSYRTPRSGPGAAPAERFAPGDLLLERYRIAGLLGKGGMGEVYRADDLTLGQPVALKFLPAILQKDDAWRERFYNEARTAREVSHPAVCRVHDIGEVEGQPFLSMEYVDGEDLAGLVRRIGRLPGDKATDIARQLCAGLAAAHDKGVLHRDLKPQNVMLDGRGKVRITDFGLAGLAETIEAEDVRSGTPAYMSPEQLQGREVTKKSDIFSLGLVLYEVFTGRRAYPGRSLSEIKRQHDDPVPPPSTIVADIAPEAERAIAQCLDPDPARRPSSALLVSAMLPGGDPLAAALAAGETPSPEMVAAAGRSEGMRPAYAWACVGIIVASVAGLLILSRDSLLMDRLADVKPPAVLEDRARELLSKLAGGGAVVDWATSYAFDSEYSNWAEANEPRETRYSKVATGEPALAWFWMRQSPRPLVSQRGGGDVQWGSPPPYEVSGMSGVRLDLTGRLLSFYNVPPQVAEEGAPAGPADFAPFFAEARLDPAAFREAASRWTPPFFCDARFAWEGTYPKRPELPLRIEACSFRGQPVSFFLVNPWTRPERQQAFQPTAGQVVNNVLYLVLLGLLLVSGAALARHHLKAGRGDRRGAFRLVGAIFALGMLSWLFDAHHVADRAGETQILGRAAGEALVVAAVLWLFYIALEPYVRRHWPHTIISWTRVLGGSFHDPHVGRDTLVGAVWGASLAVLLLAMRPLGRWLGFDPAMPFFGYLDAFLGASKVLGTIVALPLHAISLSVAALLLLLLLKTILRRERWAALVLCVILTALQALQQSFARTAPWWFNVLLAAVIMGSLLLLLLRWGLLSAVAGITVCNTLLLVPLSMDLGSWRSSPTKVVLLAVGAIVFFAFRASQSGLTRSAPAPR